MTISWWESGTSGMSLVPSSVGPYALHDDMPIAPLWDSRDGLHIFRVRWRPGLHTTTFTPPYAGGTVDGASWTSWEEQEGHVLTWYSHDNDKCHLWLVFSMN